LHSRSRLASTVLDTRAMLRSLSILALACSTAAAAPETDTLTLAGQAYMSFIGPMAGGSIHYEHRPADSNVGVTLRADAWTGDDAEDDSGPYSVFGGLAGLRRHWDPAYAELEVGVEGLRQGRSVDIDDRKYGVRWATLPELQGTFGFRLGPVDVGISLQIPLAGLGLHFGLAID
jgi:hypothetical protein